MKLLIGVAVGYLLGTKAGRERYESIVRAARRVGGSQTVQSAAGVLRSQLGTAAHRALGRVGSATRGGYQS